jgi:two-component system KDP operon response regulator KdpE
MRILVVEDEPEMLALLSEWLEEDGYQVKTAGNAWDALEAFVELKPALTITDLRMPGMDGFQLIRRIRQMSDAHVMALTALDGDEHTIRGLDLGADEYLRKPISKRVLLAHVRSLLRRAEPDDDVPVEYSDSTVTINFLTHQATVLGEPLHLRPTEFRLLVYLVQNPERVLSHQELLDRVGGPQTGSLESLKWYISSLRAKIGKTAGAPRQIATVPGVGYQYRANNGANNSVAVEEPSVTGVSAES